MTRVLREVSTNQIMASIFRKMEREKANVGHCLIEYRESQGHGSSARLEITVVLKSGITKSYRIPTMELDQSYDFKIDHTQVSNHFTCEAKLLKLYMEHMSLRAEEFELKVGETSLEMASYTVGVSSETEILKHPLGTRIALGVEEFLSAKLEIGLAIIIRLKELRTLVSLADSFQNRTTLTCFFHKPEYPMLMEISGPMVPAGVALVYIFMTHGRYNDNLPIEADRPFLIREEGIADENKEDGNDSQAPSMVAVVPRVEVDLSGEDDSVRWDNSMQVDEIPQASRAANYNRNVDTMDEDEDLEDDFDQQLASFADELEKRALGPTQNASQARGLFD